MAGHPQGPARSGAGRALAYEPLPDPSSRDAVGKHDTTQKGTGSVRPGRLQALRLRRFAREHAEQICTRPFKNGDKAREARGGSPIHIKSDDYCRVCETEYQSPLRDGFC